MNRNFDNLPIAKHLPELKKVLFQQTRAVLSAPPGAGKTTLVPLSLLDEPWLSGQKIIILEPRRLAARAAAHRMSFMLGEAVGKTVGYRMRMDRRVSAATRIEVVTEGILTRLIQSDPELSGVGLVIFDEFHERSIYADTGLALCLDVQEGLREDLRLLVMSATLHTEAVSGLLKNSPIVQSKGRQFSIETRYLGDHEPRHSVTAVTGAVLKALSAEEGSILVFLPGAGEIRQVRNQLSRALSDPSVRIAPLYGGLPEKDQALAIQPAPAGMRKIVLATAIAETSLTIEGIRIVIDAGLMRVPRFDVRSGMSRLVTIPVTRDTATQRRGRAGRLESGICYRLWSEAFHRALIQHGSPEILNADLAPLALELANWGVSDVNRLSWLDPPPSAAFSQARALLAQLGVLDKRGHITAHGKHLASLGLHPRLGHMLLRGKALGLGGLACEVAALLGERDIVHSPPGQRELDLRLRVEILHAFQKTGNATSNQTVSGIQVNVGVCRRVLKTAAHLKASLSCGRGKRREEACGLLLAFAYPDRIACRRSGDVHRFQLSNGRGAFLSPGDPLAASDYIVAASLDGDKQEAKVFLAAPVTFEDLTAHFDDHMTRLEKIYWHRREQAVKAVEQICLGKAVLKTRPMRNPDSIKVAEAMCEGVRQMGIDTLPWTKVLRAWQSRILLMRKVDGDGDSWPDVSNETLASTLDKWLLPYLDGTSRRGQLRHLDLKNALFSMLSWQQKKNLDRLAPTHITVPSGSRIPIDYQGGDVPALAVRLQEMFGAVDTPTIAGGKMLLLVHLLSPAGRPVQVTRDLKSFWKHAYYEVKKDLMGRYPKHHWPEDPSKAQPTNRVKKKNRNIR
jgi:ATP-dependent RNA helicase HrpB